MRCRALVPVIVLCALLVLPITSAVPGGDGFELNVTPLGGPVTPLYDQGEADVTVHVPCADVLLAREPRAVNVTVSAPAWAETAVHPEALPLPAVCAPGTRVTLSASLYVNTSANAPAFAPQDLRLDAVLATVTGDREATATARVEAGYLTLVAASAEQPVRVARPNEDGRFRIGVVSLGNGETRLTFTVRDVTPGWRVALPDTAVVGPHEGTIRSGTHAFDATFAPPSDLPPGRHFAHLELEVRGTSVRDDPNARGDAASVEVVLAALGANPVTGERTVPGGHFLLFLALAAVAGRVVKVYSVSGRKRSRER